MRFYAGGDGFLRAAVGFVPQGFSFSYAHYAQHRFEIPELQFFLSILQVVVWHRQVFNFVFGDFFFGGSFVEVFFDEFLGWILFDPEFQARQLGNAVKPTWFVQSIQTGIANSSSSRALPRDFSIATLGEAGKQLQGVFVFQVAGHPNETLDFIYGHGFQKMIGGIGVGMCDVIVDVLFFALLQIPYKQEPIIQHVFKRRHTQGFHQRFCRGKIFLGGFASRGFLRMGN